MLKSKEDKASLIDKNMYNICDSEWYFKSVEEEIWTCRSD